MTRNELKKLLEEYQYDDKYLKEKVKEIERIKKQCNALADDEQKETLKEFIKKEDQRLRFIMSKKDRVEDIINCLDQPLKTLMYLKYIRFFTFDQVADAMSYSTKRIYQLHYEAVDKLLDTMNGSNPAQSI